MKWGLIYWIQWLSIIQVQQCSTVKCPITYSIDSIKIQMIRVVKEQEQSVILNILEKDFIPPINF